MRLETTGATMLYLMQLKDRLVTEFFSAEHISNFSTGELIGMDDKKLDEMIISVHEDGLELGRLFARQFTRSDSGR